MEPESNSREQAAAHRNDGPNKQQLLEIFRLSSLINQVDQAIRQQLTRGKLKANFYSPRGQEVVAAAMAVNLRQDDYVVTIYRGLHDQLAKGVPLKPLMAEYYGRATGSCKGKGGGMHITHPDAGVMVTTGIVGSGMPIANGLALASQVRGDGRVTVTNFGDGASNIGAFHESLNLAALWKLPVIFLCQNNLFAEHTATENCTAGNIVDRAAGYGMLGVRVDGNDAEAMFAVARDAVARARAGEGPTLIEAMTFRFFGHNFGDPGHYIPAPLLEEKRGADPAPRLRKLLLDRGVANEEELGRIESAIAAEVLDAIEFAQASPWPEERENLIDLYNTVLDAA